MLGYLPINLLCLIGIENFMTPTVKLLTFGGFFSFFIFGFIDNLKGPLLPEVLRDENMIQGGLSYRQGGTVFLAAYIGFVVATMLTGIMSDLLNNRRVMLLAGIFLCAGILGLNISSLYPVLLLSMFVIGLGLGAIEVGGNGLMVELHSESRARYLNLLATFHGVGSLLVPLVAAWLLASRLEWQQIYLCAAALAGSMRPAPTSMLVTATMMGRAVATSSEKRARSRRSGMALRYRTYWVTPLASSM